MPRAASSGSRSVSNRRPAPDGPVEGRAGDDKVGAEHGTHRPADSSHPVEREPRRVDDPPHRTGQIHAANGELAHGVDEQAPVERRRLGLPRDGGRLHGRGGREVEQCEREVHPRDAVGERMVRLVDQPDVATVVDSLRPARSPTADGRGRAAAPRAALPIGAMRVDCPAPAVASVVRDGVRRSSRRRSRSSGRVRAAPATSACGTAE